METIFDKIGTRVDKLIDLLEIEPDMIFTKGLNRHKEVVKNMREKEENRNVKCYSCLHEDVSAFDEPCSSCEGVSYWEPVMSDKDVLEKYKWEIENPYGQLENVLQRALDQASKGKGKERHGGDTPFGDQPMQVISELLKSERGLLFQAMKKIVESQRLDKGAAIEELLGAIVYIAGAIIYKEQN